MRRRLSSTAFLIVSTIAVGVAGPSQQQQLQQQATQSLATEIAAKLSSENKRRVAVLPFRDINGASSLLGTFLAEELTTALFGRTGIEIVERTLLDRIMGELKLNATGAVDATSVKQLGKLIGADAIVTGTITDLATSVAVNSRLMDTQTGQVFAAAQARIAKDDDIRRLMGPQAAGPEGGPVTPPALAVGGSTSASVAAPARPVPPSQTQAKAIKRTGAEGFAFDLFECRNSAGGIVCLFTITNQREDSWLRIDQNSTLIDSRGRVFGASRQTVANQVTRMGERGVPLVRGVSTEATVAFENVGENVTRISLLELKGYARESWYVAQFRDVPVTSD